MTRLLGVQGVIGTVVTAVVLGFAVRPAGAACPPDSVESGPVCIDKYEASLWHVPPTMRALIKRIQNGTVTLANLTAPAALAAGVAHVGLTPAVSSSNDLEDAGCPVAGNGCLDVYAVSIPGVRPSTGMSWAQAAAAARNSQKRLPTNQEWQVAALGTPEGATCPNPSTVAATGSNPACVSDVGAVDMVGNAHEWVADWIPGTTGCGAPLFGLGGPNCLALDGGFPLGGAAVIVRGESGVFGVNGQRSPAAREDTLGFRAIR